MSEKSKQNPNQKMRVKFITLGCKVNQYETQGLKEKFISLGANLTQGKPDCYVINTCTVTQRADKKSKEAILRAKKENPQARIAVCGCLAQCDREYIELLGVDYIVGQDKKHLLPEIVLSGSTPPIGGSDSTGIWSLGIRRFSQQRAFVKIQDGCNNYCSFCKIPYVRGPSRSRDYKQVLDECEAVSRLHKEIVICGINIGLYGRDLTPPCTLAMLTADILRRPSVGRVRFSSLEPAWVDEALLSLLDNPRLCPHLHFPFQYGDDIVLKAMNKKETVDAYEQTVRAARRIKADIAISCDIMVGFPGENEETFTHTMEFLKRIRPMRMHIFSFSPRQNTSLANVATVPVKEMRRRYIALKKIADVFSTEYARKFIGRKLLVIPERRQGGFSSGYSENYLKVYIEDPVVIGKPVAVKVKCVTNNRIYARVAYAG